MTLEHKNDIKKMIQETNHLTTNYVFFPELVWKSTLKKIRKPIDIESCSNASPYFWKLLQDKRQTKVVIPFVIQQMSRFFYKYQSEDNGDGKESSNDNGKVSMKDFWKLRETCKSWNSIIEHLHHSVEAGHFEMQPDMESFENLHLRNWSDESFDSSQLPHLFLSHFEATHFDLVERKPKRNPFLGRNVQFNDVVIARHMPDIYHLYLDGLQKLVTRYGKEIWYVSFVFQEIGGINPTQIYSCLTGCLKRMPNLKVLRVACNHKDLQGDEATQAALAEYRHTCMEAVLRDIIENPIPAMPQLEFIWAKDVPTPIFNELLWSNRHVTKLRVDRKEHHGDYNIFEDELHNLTSLHLTFCSEADFEQFENFRFRLNLERFYFLYDGTSEHLSWSKLFRALEIQLGESCNELLIQMPSPKTENESVHAFDDTTYDRLNLKNLKHVAIVCDNAVALDFLLPAKKSLRSILVRFLNGDEDEFILKRFKEFENKQLVELIGFQERMGESNIWVAFPELVKFNLFRTNELGGCISYILRACSKEQRFFDIRGWFLKMN